MPFLAVATLLCAVALGAAAVAATPQESLDLAGERAQLLQRIRESPRDAEAFAALATWLFRAGDLPRAAAAAAEAARLDPDVARYQRLLGYLRAAGGADREAEAAFRRAARLDPSARVSLADFHIARAWAEYQEALRHGTPDPAVEERLRGLAAVAELSPELKALVRSSWDDEPGEVADSVPPIALGDSVDYALVVEKRTQTLRLYGRQDGELVLLHTYPCTSGEEPGAKQRRGDRRTPDGVYVTTDLLPGDALPDLYGALAMPLSYPNAWDRLQRRDGYGIWLHGSDRLSSPFNPRETRGCIIVRNEDLIALARILAPQVTPVLIAEEIAYRPKAEWKAAVQAALQHDNAGEWLAVVATADYTVVMRRDADGGVVRDFLRPQDGWRAVASERSPVPSAEKWNEKIAGVLPQTTGALLRVSIRDGGEPPAVIIETSNEARVRGFRPETGEVVLDLAGVRPAPMPARLEGNGPWVKEVRVTATQIDPPSTRVVIDLERAADYRISTEGTRTVVSLLAERG